MDIRFIDINQIHFAQLRYLIGYILQAYCIILIYDINKISSVHKEVCDVHQTIHTMRLKTLDCDFTAILGYLYCFLKCFTLASNNGRVCFSMQDGPMYNKLLNL